MKLQLIGTTFIKNKKQEPIFKVAKMLATAPDHFETVEFSYPPVDGVFPSDEDIVADLPNKEKELSAHWLRVIEAGFTWNAYEQRWSK